MHVRTVICLLGSNVYVYGPPPLWPGDHDASAPAARVRPPRAAQPLFRVPTPAQPQRPLLCTPPFRTEPDTQRALTSRGALSAPAGGQGLANLFWRILAQRNEPSQPRMIPPPAATPARRLPPPMRAAVLRNVTPAHTHHHPRPIHPRRQPTASHSTACRQWDAAGLVTGVRSTGTRWRRLDGGLGAWLREDGAEACGWG